MLAVADERELATAIVEPETLPARPRLRSRLWLKAQCRECARLASGWLFGVLSLVLGLSMLAALPVIQFLSLGYFLESSARVARSGRIQVGFVGVRKAARVGGITAGIWLSLVPTWLVATQARAAELISPGGKSAIMWRVGLFAVTVLAGAHIGVSCLAGGESGIFFGPSATRSGWCAGFGKGASTPTPATGCGRGGQLARSVLLPTRPGRVFWHALVACHSGCFDRSRGRRAAVSTDRDAAPRDRRAFSAVSSSAICARGQSEGSFLAPGDSRSIPLRRPGRLPFPFSSCYSPRFRYTC